jgi:Protein of unknown function (DUF1565)
LSTVWLLSYACSSAARPQTAGTDAEPGSIASPSATSQVVYVSSSADAAGNGSAGQPFRTIQQGVDKASAGSTVLVSAGTYAGFTVTRDGVTVAAAPGALVSVRGGGADVIEFDGVSGGAPTDWTSPEARRRTARR